MVSYKRTEQIWIQPTPQLRRLCHITKNLYNEANFLIRQELFNERKWLRYTHYYHKVKHSANYKLLPAQTAQQILQQLDRNWKAFFHTMKIWNEHPEKFRGRPRPPKYKRKEGEHLLIFTNQQVKLDDQWLHFPKKVSLQLKTRLGNSTNIREVRIVPKGVGYVMEIVYDKELTPLNLDKNRAVGLDLGLTNLVTVVNNIDLNPIVIKGGMVKSINQYYNKEHARLISIYDRQERKGKKLIRLTNKRNRMLHDRFHKLSRKIADYCITNNIGSLVIGYNNGWKQHLNLGKQINQHFMTIPYYLLIHIIHYKAEELGIQVIKVSENYTSKCSFLDNEPITKHYSYQGKRITRSWFQTRGGRLIHTDVNGAYNIMRKAFPKAFAANGIEAVGLQPTRWRLATATG
ncbi:MAG: RNA-guided endonuclease InsQ/TnpB family protein [Candidatus Hodarchaeota archaeon]